MRQLKIKIHIRKFAISIEDSCFIMQTPKVLFCHSLKSPERHLGQVSYLFLNFVFSSSQRFYSAIPHLRLQKCRSGGGPQEIKPATRWFGTVRTNGWLEILLWKEKSKDEPPEREEVPFFALKQPLQRRNITRLQTQ